MTPYALPPPIVTIVHGFTPEQMQQAFKDGAASRDGEVEALRADAAKWRVFVKRVNSPPSPTHNQWKLVEVCSMYGDEKELIYWEQIVADIAAEATK